MKTNRFQFLRRFASVSALALALVHTPSTGAVNFFDPTVPSQFPQTIAETGIYTNLTTKTLDTAVKYFEVNSALWSDAAHKDRWIILPPGTSIPYVDTTDVFSYPDGTIFVKLFRHDTVTGDTNSRIYWETRLLVKKTTSFTSWHGFSYKWNKAGTNATLVNRDAGLDTTLSLGSAPGYRKWVFPSLAACEQCHRPDPAARGVLGFWPAQLKRPARTNPSINQVTDLFNKGVFSGAQPTAGQLSRRFRGMSEPIPSGLSPAERFKVIDTMARSYIASNCSGCHGNKGLATGATGGCIPNFDYYNLTPMMEFNEQFLGSWGLDGPDTVPASENPNGRAQFLLAIKEWGIPTTGTNAFVTAKPTGTMGPALVYPGHPTFSSLIYRQIARKSPLVDSASLYRSLYYEGGPNQGWKAWIFKEKWGSKAWKDTLRGRGVTINQVLGAEFGLTNDGNAMPPLASFIPDTTAIKVMGEWVKGYTPVSIRNSANVAGVNTAMPSIRNRMLIVPTGWTGKAVMTSLNGRTVPLNSVGPNRYALPANLKPGVYFFKVGNKSFRTSFLR